MIIWSEDDADDPAVGHVDSSAASTWLRLRRTPTGAAAEQYRRLLVV
jgi:hypothetical protein